jgi:hypothetical protein
MASMLTAISLGPGDMKITPDDIRKKFNALESGEESREDIADFAFRAIKANDARTLEMEPAFRGQDMEGDPLPFGRGPEKCR